MRESQDLSAKRASLTAGIFGAVMLVLVCFVAALVFSDLAGEKAGQQSPEASVEADGN